MNTLVIPVEDIEEMIRDYEQIENTAYDKEDHLIIRSKIDILNELLRIYITQI